MPEGSEFHTEGTAMLKLQETKVVWTRGTDWCRRTVENMQGCGS